MLSVSLKRKKKNISDYGVGASPAVIRNSPRRGFWKEMARWCILNLKVEDGYAVLRLRSRACIAAPKCNADVNRTVRGKE